MSLHGRDWIKVAKIVKSRDRKQTKKYGDWLLTKYKKDSKMQNHPLVKLLEKKRIIKKAEHWNDEEDERFLQALEFYGKDWNKIQECVGTKTHEQTKTRGQYLVSKFK